MVGHFPLMVGISRYKLIAYLCTMKRYYLKYYDQFVLLVWAFIFGVFWLQYMPAMNILEAFLLSACIVLSAYPFTTYLSKFLLKKAVEKKNMFKFVIQFFIVCLLFSLFIPLFSIIFYHLEQYKMFPDSRFFETGQTLLYDYISAFLVSLILNFGFCGLRFFELNLKLQEELSESRLQILQAQINPHFMFNVLNHIHVLIRKEPELADNLLLQYTDILRYQLYSGKKDFITIDKEVDFLKNFIEVEKVRWKNKLDITCNWNIENGNTELPPLLFITFIENAFKHVSRSNSERGYIKIDLNQKNSIIHLSVENSNDFFDISNKEDSGIGLANIKRRLEILFPNNHALETTCNNVFYSTILTIKL